MADHGGGEGEGQGGAAWMSMNPPDGSVNPRSDMLHEMAKLDPADWMAVQLRLTAFPVVPAPSGEVNWWQQLVGEVPEELAANSKKQSASAGGPFGGGGLVLQMQPDRIDWVYQPIPVDLSDLAAEPRILSVGPADKAVSEFKQLMAKWLALPLPEFSRLAFGGIIQHQEESREAGYRRLPEYLPVKVDVASSDFLYQINYPTEHAGLRINRLSKWSVQRVHLARFTAALENPALTFGRLVQELFALQVELDINTALTAEAIAADRLGPLFEQLVAFGVNILRSGPEGK